MPCILVREFAQNDKISKQMDGLNINNPRKFTKILYILNKGMENTALTINCDGNYAERNYKKWKGFVPKNESNYFRKKVKKSVDN